MTSVSVFYGYGKHLDDLDPIQSKKMPLVANIAGTFSILAALWSKTSFAMTVLRISTGWVRWTILTIIMSMTIAMGSAALFEWVRCMPIQKSWIEEVEGTCWPMSVIVTYYQFMNGKPTSLPLGVVELGRLMSDLHVAYSGAMDITLAIFPWIIIHNMRISRKEKFGVMVAMSMGVL